MPTPLAAARGRACLLGLCRPALGGCWGVSAGARCCLRPAGLICRALWVPGHQAAWGLSTPQLGSQDPSRPLPGFFVCCSGHIEIFLKIFVLVAFTLFQVFVDVKCAYDLCTVFNPLWVF